MCKKIYPLLLLFLYMTGNLMAQTPPCTEYPSPSIAPNFIALCQDPKDVALPINGSTANRVNDPGNDPLEDCFRACSNTEIIYSSSASGNSFFWEVFGDGTLNTGTGLPPHMQSITWHSPGTGMVQVTETTPDGCSTTVNICVVIVQSPDAKFTSIPEPDMGEITICVGGSVIFQDLSSDDAISWAWDFGDGGLSNDPSPTHQYNTPGTYEVTLTVYNDCGCSDEMTMTVIVEPTAAPIVACISTVCAGEVGTYSVTNACDGASFFWSAIGGNIADPTTNPVNVQWADPSSGVGLLTVEVFGCNNTCPIPTTVEVPILTPTISLDGPQVVCVGDLVEYTLPPQPSTTYDWSMTNTNTGNTVFFFTSFLNDHSADVHWQVAGDYEICVTPNHTIAEWGCKEYDEMCMTVKVRPPFTISGSAEEICEGEQVVFTATPSISCVWKAIDTNGNIIDLLSGPPTQTPSPTVFNTTLPAGSYEITAVPLFPNPNVCNSEAQTFLIVKPAAPAFDVGTLIGDITVCPGSSHNYTAVPDDGYFISWDVQGGTQFGSGNEIAITWGPTPPYQITITQESMLEPSCSSEVIVDVFELIHVEPSIDNGGISKYCTDGVGTFSVPNDPNITSFEWSVSGAEMGSVVAGQNTEEIDVKFNNDVGIATIILEYYVCDVLHTISKEVDVVSEPVITLNVPVEACQNADPATMFSASIPSDVTGSISWSWDFGGTPVSGGNGFVDNVNFSFPTFGTQVVSATVTVTGGSCPGTFTATQLIDVLPAPLVNITAQFGNALCPDNNFTTVLVASVQNSAGNPGGNYTYQWSNGDVSETTIITTPGVYTLTVFDPNGCKTSADFEVFPCPNLNPPCIGAAFSFNQDCNEFNFNGTLFNGFTNNPTWTFGDGSSATGLNANHTYDHSGYYTVMFSGTNNSGDVCADIQTVQVSFVPNFIAEFSCPGNMIEVDLINQTDHLSGVEDDLTYFWKDANNTFISSAENPTNVDLSPFTQPITLDVFYNNPFGPNYTCSVTETINVPSPIVASFTVADGVCEGTPVVFTDNSTGTAISATWDFGDGSGSNLLPVTERTYDFANPITATLTVVDEFGCSSTDDAPITIIENPFTGLVNINNPGGPSCPAASLTANPSTAPNYDWFLVDNMGADLPQGGNSATLGGIGTTGNYYVIVSDPTSGCSEQSDNQEIIVIPAPVAFILGANSYCPGEEISLSANQGTEYDYQWSISPTPPGTPSSYTDPDITFDGTPGVTYTVNVTVENTATGCATTSPDFMVEVHTTPSISIENTEPNCAPATITSSPSADITSIVWSTGSTAIDTEVLGGGTIEVTGYTDEGCSASATHEVGTGPDLSDVAVGCYCFSQPVTWTAPAGPFYSYEWYQEGVNGIQGTGQQFYIDESGVYYVIVYDQNGCSSTSDPIIIDIGGDCAKCEFEVRPLDLTCIGYDEMTGGTLYSWTSYILNYYISLSGMTGYSAEGIVGPITPSTIPGGGAVTPISGTFILLPGFTSATIVFQGAGADGLSCEYKLEVPKFPECGTPPPCEVTWEKFQVKCLYNLNGWNYYSFSVQAVNAGATISNVVWYPCHAPKVILTSNTSTLPGGTTTQIEGIIKVREDIPNDCFQICGWDEVHKQKCCWKLIIDFPPCKPIKPCTEVKIVDKSLWCVEPLTDFQGNNVYYFNIDAWATIAGGDAYLIPYISQGENHVSDLNVTVSGNNYNLTGTIFDVPQYDDPLCFILVVIKNGQPCYTKICMKLPKYCFSQGGPKQAKIQIDNAQNDMENGTLKLAPNPASTMIMVDYQSDFIGDTSLKLMGLDGQVLMHYSKLQTTRQIPLDVSSLQGGMYFLGIYEDGILKAQEKVVVLGD